MFRIHRLVAASQHHRARALVAATGIVAVGALVLAASLIVAPVLATPPSGVTSMAIAKGSFADIDATAKTDTNPNARTDFWQARIDAKGASDLAIRQNTIAPGGNSGWDSHPGVSLVIVKSGTAALYFGDDPTCTPHLVEAGTGFAVSGGRVHIVRNEGSVDLVEVVTLLIPAGVAGHIDQPSPGSCPF